MGPVSPVGPTGPIPVPVSPIIPLEPVSPKSPVSPLIVSPIWPGFPILPITPFSPISASSPIVPLGPISPFWPFSPFKPFKLKWYCGKIAVGTPYFYPRRWITNPDKPGYQTAVDKKIGFDFVGLGWKTKFESYRFESAPLISFVFFKWQNIFFIKSMFQWISQQDARSRLKQSLHLSFYIILV